MRTIKANTKANGDILPEPKFKRARQQTIKINRLSKENDQLSKELEHVKEQLRWSRITSSQETELKNSCFFFIAAKGLFTEWHEWHDKRITERLMDEIKRTIK